MRQTLLPTSGPHIYLPTVYHTGSPDPVPVRARSLLYTFILFGISLWVRPPLRGFSVRFCEALPVQNKPFYPANQSLAAEWPGRVPVPEPEPREKTVSLPCKISRHSVPSPFSPSTTGATLPSQQ